VESLEVIARPHFEKADLAWLTDIRTRRAGNRGPPYFTLVFSGVDMPARDFAARIRVTAAAQPRVRFHLRSALVVPEPSVGRFHVFLIPDEGFSAILRLHDALHVGPIEAALRPETPYLPHITVATSSDYAEARRIAASLNADGGIDIKGHIEALEVERRRGEVIKLVAEVPLAKTGWFD
jgi:2'-5' RNA ligase